jgi:hypothetical protein
MAVCPVDFDTIFSALTNGQFAPFTKQDEMTFAGVEYSGYTWTPKIDGYDKGEIIVVLDRGPGGLNFNVVLAKADGVNQTWAAEVRESRWTQIEG